MEMVSCSGCARDICQGTAACPGCGASQAVPSTNNTERNVFKLIGLGLLYSLVAWFVTMFVTGFVIGVVAGADGPASAAASAEKMGQMLSGPILLGAIVVVVVLTVCGKLPGTAKPKDATLP